MEGVLDNPIVSGGVVGLTELFSIRRVTPSEAVEVYLSRIKILNPMLNAFLTEDQDGALRDAAASTARWADGSPLSALDGVPFGIKANIAVAGLPWHAGIGAYRDRRASRDADCVAVLRAAGAVILGGLNMHEAGLGATTDNLAFGRCHNPHRLDFTPGGSSGGSAVAVSAGLCAAALGTDTMGSVRIPASYCGVFGHMLERSSISTSGVVPLSWTLDAIGILARSADDAAVVVQVLAGKPQQSQAKPLTCAVIDFEGQIDLEESVASAFYETIEHARAANIAIERVVLGSYDVAAMRRVCLLISEVEGFCEHQAALAADPEGFSANLRVMLDWGARQSAPKMASTYRRFANESRQIQSELATFDAILTPTTAGPAFASTTTPPSTQADLTLLANIPGWAATAFPIGMNGEGLPLSAQVISPDGSIALGVAIRIAKASPAPGLFGR